MGHRSTPDMHHLSFCGATAQIGPRPPNCPLPTQQTQETNIDDVSGIFFVLFSEFLLLFSLCTFSVLVALP
jgi:NADH:ubiquinone oxidoreductase subunit 6 (subunit J)